ncbi:MAG: M56 family metallopeptidase, partial [Clostridia bacterium]|nr:M56 family metallopeptidase [Clostridia bacterium]
MLEKMFALVLNMTFMASIAAIFVMLVRFILHKKLPRTFSYALWVIVLIRLLIPITVSSGFSIFNVLPSSVSTSVPTPTPMSIVHNSKSINTLEYNFNNIIPLKELPADKNNKITSNETLDISLPETAPYISVNPMQVILFLLSLVWVTGVLSLFLYGILTYI